MNGLVVIDKPVGPTSMDVIRVARRAAWVGLGQPAGGARRIKCGHAGTLDPLASGVLLVCVGNATKAVPGLMGMTKEYEAMVDLSAFTTTDDREGEQQEVAVATPPTAEAVERACESLVGPAVWQVPPAFSAVHVRGQRAYKIARAGEAVTMPPRQVSIEQVAIRAYVWPRLEIAVTCGKGTYIRSIARDLGRALGTGGHLAALRRTAVGDYRIEQALPMSLFDQPLRADSLRMLT